MATRYTTRGSSLLLRVYGDGYRAEGRRSVNTKVCITDEVGGVLLHVEHIP